MGSTRNSPRPGTFNWATRLSRSLDSSMRNVDRIERRRDDRGKNFEERAAFLAAGDIQDAPFADRASRVRRSRAARCRCLRGRRPATSTRRRTSRRRASWRRSAPRECGRPTRASQRPWVGSALNWHGHPHAQLHVTGFVGDDAPGCFCHAADCSAKDQKNASGERRGARRRAPALRRDATVSRAG